ncbi:MAG: YfhO family protein [Lachnospiraceae bacterium]|nr:YfhO family protein [Lachnospiraceae bacterium]
MKHILRDKNFIRTFFFCALLGCICLLPFYVQDGFAFALTEDFNSETIPFAVAVVRAVKGGNTWLWDLDLGSPLFTGMSYFNLWSPFRALALPFPTLAFPKLVVFFMILKYAFAGGFAYLYVRRFVREEKWAVIGGVLYAFSGFQTMNLMFEFQDMVAFFPLLLLGLEQAMDASGSASGRGASAEAPGTAPAAAQHGDLRLFIFAVFLNCVLNYFFFVQEVLFLILYFIFRFWDKDLRLTFRRIGTCFFCGITGVLMAGVVFLPNILYIMGNPRTELKGLRTLFWEIDRVLFVMKGFLLPGETMHDHASAIREAWDSTSCYLPLFGLSLPFSYMMKMRRDWLTRLIAVCAVISFVPPLNSVFLLFTIAVYHRWWFMLVLLLAVSACRVLQSPEEYPIRGGILVYLILVFVYTCMAAFLHAPDGSEMIFHPARLALYVLMAIAWPAAAMILYRNSSGKSPRAAGTGDNSASPDAGIHNTGILAYKNTLLLLCAAVIATTMSTVYFYRKDAHTKSYLADLAAFSQLDNYDEQYRYNTNQNMVSMIGDVAGTSSFSSTVSNAIVRFDALFDHRATHKRMGKDDYPYLAALVGGRYRVDVQPPEDANRTVKELDTGYMHYYVTEHEACPIGYAVSHYITVEDLKKYPVEQRAAALLSAAAVEEKDVPLLQDLLTNAEEIRISYAGYPYILCRETEALFSDSFFNPSLQDAADEAMEILIHRNQAQAVSDFRRTKNGLTCATHFDTDRFVYFTVPNDEGFTITIDGKKALPVDSGGMVLLRVPAGDHRIAFVYRTPYLAAGAVLSIIGFALFLAVCRRRIPPLSTAPAAPAP